jgi:bacterioferritin B
MMLASDTLIQAFNEQIGHEMGASLHYLAIASYFDRETLPQLARFFYRQSEEERMHALKFVKFLVDVGGVVSIPELPSASSDLPSAEAAVQRSLESEERVTRQIYALVESARGESNYIALRFLDWFVDEQREEVATMGALLHVIRRAGPDGLLRVEDYLARSGGAPPLEGGAGGEGT